MDKAKSFKYCFYSFCAFFFTMFFNLVIGRDAWGICCALLASSMIIYTGLILNIGKK